MLVDSAAATALLRSMPALGPLRAMFMPLQTPADVVSGWAPSVRLSEEDKQSLSTIRVLMELMAPQGVGGMATGSQRAMRVAGELVPLLPELMPGAQGGGSCDWLLPQGIRVQQIRAVAHYAFGCCFLSCWADTPCACTASFSSDP